MSDARPTDSSSEEQTEGCEQNETKLQLNVSFQSEKKKNQR